MCAANGRTNLPRSLVQTTLQTCVALSSNARQHTRTIHALHIIAVVAGVDDRLLHTYAGNRTPLTTHHHPSTATRPCVELFCRPEKNDNVELSTAHPAKVCVCTRSRIVKKCMRGRLSRGAHAHADARTHARTHARPELIFRQAARDHRRTDGSHPFFAKSHSLLMGNCATSRRTTKRRRRPRIFGQPRRQCRKCVLAVLRVCGGIAKLSSAGIY